MATWSFRQPLYKDFYVIFMTIIYKWVMNKSNNDPKSIPHDVTKITPPV